MFVTKIQREFPDLTLLHLEDGRVIGGSDLRFVISEEVFDEFGEEHYEPKGGAHTFDDAILFANSLYSSLTKGE